MGDHRSTEEYLKQTGVATPEQRRAQQIKLSDLDRCVHGRHSIDDCLDCPTGRSAGNTFLDNGQRIGTDVGGNPIMVTTKRPHRRDVNRVWPWERPDPTHGRIDPDIQQSVGDMNPKDVGQRVAIENTLQEQRDGGGNAAQIRGADAGQQDRSRTD